MDDNQLYLGFFKWISIAVCVLIVSASGYCNYQNHLIEEAIKSGADPLAVKCALTESSNLCTQVMLSRGDNANTKENDTVD